MIKEYEFFHGAVFSKMAHKVGGVSIAAFKDTTNSSYILNGRCGLYIKYSKKRLTPWMFTFMLEHQKEIKEMADSLQDVLIVFVCNDNGICCITYAELKEILDENYEKAENVSIYRNPRKQYRVKGRDGQVKYRISEGDFEKKVSAAIKSSQNCRNLQLPAEM